MDTERVADQVLQNKMEIVELDKRRQSTREALRDVGKSNDKKCWITVGPILVKMEREKAMGLLKKGKYTEILNISIANQLTKRSPLIFKQTNKQLILK